jgi:beta-glucosidase
MQKSQITEQASVLLSQMTLQEKIGQLVQFSSTEATGPDDVKVDLGAIAQSGSAGSIINVAGASATNALQRLAVEHSRLKIPILFGLDVIHGYRTIYPIPLALAASWDLNLFERCARMAAVEASSQGIRWTFSPMVDIARDARWGRITEGSGEDPYFGEKAAAAWVRGYQGEDLTVSTSIAACAKHFVAYGAAEGGREYELADVSDRALRDVYLPPFKAAIDAGAATIMSSFTSLQGVPASANKRMLTDILRKEWGFEGFVVSDWNSVGELIEHGVALNGSDAAFKALSAGVDVDMCGNVYLSHLNDLIESGKLTVDIIDRAVERVLKVKIGLGLFDNPYTDETLGPSVILCPEHLDIARQAAEESFVLLKNDPVGASTILPLSPTQSVALIGPLADSQRDMLGSWNMRGEAEDAVTLRMSLSEKLNEKLTYVRGVEKNDLETDEIDEAVEAALNADVAIMALGEHHYMSGEAASRGTLDLPGRQFDLLKAVVATGKPVVLLVFSGRPLAITWEAENVPAILQAWFPGLQAGPALVRTLYGEVNPAGKITASFPRSVGQMPLYYNTHNTGRPTRGLPPGSGFITGLIDERNTPLYPFGWGLSYTTFDYSATQLLTKSISVNDLESGSSILVKATITNTGQRAGVEIVQLYIRQRGASVSRPIRELKGFERIRLNSGESQTVEFAITKSELSFWSAQAREEVEAGELTVWIAPNSVSGTPDQILINN